MAEARKIVTESAEREFYPTAIRLEGRELYLIWYCADWSDGVVMTGDNKVAAFPTLDHLQSFAKQSGISLNHPSPEMFDFDQIARWIQSPREFEPDCKLLLDAWNFFRDIQTSVLPERRKLDKQTYRIYQKLFWGNNLPAVTPQGCHYTPVWSGKELYRVKTVLSFGLRLLKQSLTIDT